MNKGMSCNLKTVMKHIIKSVIIFLETCDFIVTAYEDNIVFFTPLKYKVIFYFILLNVN